MLSVILAAGKGTRMKSSIPKVLHKVNGKPMLKLVTEVIENVGITKNIFILGHKKEVVLEEMKNIEYVTKLDFGTFSVLKLKNNKLLPKLTESLLGLQFYGDGAFWEKGTVKIPTNGVLYGPYIDLPIGKYRVEFTCEFPKGAIGEFSVLKEAEVPNNYITSISSNEKTVVIEFELKEKAHKVEFTVRNMVNSYLKIGEKKLAENCMNVALEVLEKEVGENSNLYFNILQNKIQRNY